MIVPYIQLYIYYNIIIGLKHVLLIKRVHVNYIVIFEIYLDLGDEII